MNTASRLYPLALDMLQRFVDEQLLPSTFGYLNPVELLMSAARGYALAALPGKGESREAYWIETLQQELDDVKRAPPSSPEARPHDIGDDFPF